METLYQDDDYEITITNASGQIVDSQFGQSDINSTFNVNICVPFCVGNCCDVQITIEDKFAPVLSCNAGPFYVPCNAADLIPEPTATENCGDYDIVMIDEEELSYDCGTYTGKITRTFVGVDDQGNESLVPCIQEIFITRPIMSDIQAPSTVSFGCGSDYATDVNGNPAPWNTETNMIGSGLPIMCVSGMNTGLACHDGINPPLEGVYMMLGDQSVACNTLVTYKDELYPPNGCKETIKRTFTIREWHCNMESTWTGVQFIDIINDQDPTISCPANFTVTTEYGCVADVMLPAATVFDPCGSDVTVNIQVEGMGVYTDDDYFPGAFIQSNGGSVQLPVGENIIHYIATDACYNSSSCTMIVTVQDNTEPVAICKSNINVSLSNNGMVEVWAATFGDDSTDECGTPILEVTRLSSTCDPTDVTEWDDSVTFCCDDIGTDVMVVLRVTDAGGNSSICMMAVSVQDKTLPVMSCPAPETITCVVPYDINNLTPQFGAPTIEDNCSENDFTESVIEDINSCGIGTITRIFTVVNDAGLTVASCQQVITVVLDEEMTDDDIEWPADESIYNTCGLAAAHPDFTGYPIYEDGLCDQTGYDYDDEVFENIQGNNACAKILRTWQVANWCQTDDNGDVIIWEHLQVIVIYNTVDPVITGSCNKIVQTSTDPNCGDVFVSITNTATDDCTLPNDLNWSWNINIGLDSDPTNDISGTGPDASGTYPLGNHLIEWTVEDHCGNIDFCNQELSIVNTKTPIAVCLFGLSAELAPMDTDNDGFADTEMVILNASQFDKESYHSCGYDLFLSFSSNINDNTISFACGQEGNQTINLWVTDENGNTAICNTFVNITNNVDEGFCSLLTDIVDVEGKVITESGEDVDKVHVNLDGSNLFEMTNGEGGFAFPSMPVGGTYQVRPSKNDDLLNGVSTLDIILIQRHILQIEALTSPYQYVAADVNKSNSISAIDLIEIRKAILGINESFSNNESWRFVDARFDFDENQDPLSQDFEEEYDIPLLDSDMKTDFTGVKIGDVNGSVLANGFASNDVEDRSNDGLSLAGTMEGQRILISAEQSTRLRGMQMTIQLNNDLVKVLALNAGTLDISADSYHVNQDESLVTLSWNTTESISVEAGDILFSIQLDNELEANSLTIDSRRTKAEAYNENFEIMKIDYSTSQDTPELAVYQNEPNPWSTKTTIKYTLDKDQKVVFFFRSSEGKLLKTITADGLQGENKLFLDATDIGIHSGVIYYELQTQTDRIAKKMILVH